MSIVIHSEGRGSDTGNLSEVCPYPFGLFRAGKAKGLCESYRRDGTFHNLYTPPGSIVPDDLTQSVIFCGQFNTCLSVSLPAPAFRFRSLNLSYPFPALWAIL